MTSHWNVSWHHVKLGIPRLWLRGITGRSVTVALLDTGLADPRGLDSAAFEYRDAHGARLPHAIDEQSGHGTSAGSLIASYLGGALGIAPQAKLVSLQVLGPTSSNANIAAAFEYVSSRDDIDVVSCSFVISSIDETLRERITQLTAAGKIVIAAAGNQDEPMEFPEQIERVLTVAAVDSRGQPLQGARRGKWIDLAAPGFDLPVVLPGLQRIGRFGLSSAAAAVVSGVASLALSTRPRGPQRQALARVLETMFTKTATPLAADSSEVGSGYVNPAAVIRAAETFDTRNV
jgi:subtilisin family serine protease